MGFSRTIGRIGPLAVALGVGLAVGTMPGIAYAEPGSSSVSADGSSSVSESPGAGGGAAASSGSDATESSASGATEGSAEAPGSADTSAGDDADVDVDVAEADGEADGEADVDLDVVDDAEDVGHDDEEPTTDAGEEAADPAAGDEDDALTVEPPAASSAPESASESASESVPDGVPDAEPVSGDSADDDAAIGSEAGAVGGTDEAAVAEVEASADGQQATLEVAASAEESAPASSAASATARTPVAAAAVSSPAKPAPTLKDLADGVVRTTAQVVVDVLDWVLAASGTSYDDSELPWGLALLAGLRREIDEAFLAPYRAQQANAALVLTQSPNLLVNPGAEVGDPSLSGNSAVSIPGWTVTGTPTAIIYGTPRNSWPLGLSFPLPDLPPFMSFPKAQNGPPDGGAQFFGGGNVADSTLTQIVDLSAAAPDIDTGTVTYDLSAWLGGWLANLSSASVKVDFLDVNRTYLDSTSIGPVGVLERFFHTKLVERETSGAVPVGTRYAQVDVILDQVNIFPLGINVDYNSAFADNVSFTISADLPAPPPPTPPVSTVGELDHVFMVYMENKGYTDIIGSPNAPFINSLVNAYGSANNFFALTHPSLPNYYPIIGGTDYGLTYECTQVCIFDHGPILTTNIDDAGMTWRGYAQSQPPGQPLEASGDYSVDQLPFVAFSGIGNNEAYAVEHLFPLDQMAIDLSSSETTPDYVWFAANENFNGEGPIDTLGDVLKFMISQFAPTHQYNVPAADQFLSETVPVIMNSNVWHDPAEKSALVVTFDEDNDNLSLGFGDEGNRIVTVVIPSPAAVASGMREGHFIATTKYDHYSLMRMIEDSLGLPTLTNNDKYAVPMNEFWT